jgi:hypothetical protein
MADESHRARRRCRSLARQSRVQWIRTWRRGGARRRTMWRQGRTWRGRAGRQRGRLFERRWRTRVRDRNLGAWALDRRRWQRRRWQRRRWQRRRWQRRRRHSGRTVRRGELGGGLRLPQKQLSNPTRPVHDPTVATARRRSPA